MIKLQISSKALRNALSVASCCMASRPTLTALESVLMFYRGGKCYFVSSDTDAQITQPVPMVLQEGKFDTPVLLPQARLRSFLSTLPDVCLTLFIDIEKQSLHIEYVLGEDSCTRSGHVDFTVSRGDEFPLMPELKEVSCHVSFPSKSVVSILGSARRFTLPDELRPSFGCVCLDVKHDECVFAATTGKILYRFAYGNGSHGNGSEFLRSGESQQLLLYAKALSALSAAFSTDEDIDFRCTVNNIYINQGETELVIKKVDSKYPNYDSVIPKDCPYHVHVDAAELVSALQRISVVGCGAAEDRVVARFGGMFMTLRGEDSANGTKGEEQCLITDANVPDGFEIGFSASLLSSCIRSTSDKIRIDLTEPTRPIVLRPSDGKTPVLTLAMPMITY